MRIITGSARGTRLESMDGIVTRPTAGVVKEAVFSMIQFEIEGRQVLDLFAGSGQLSFEALSRGAAKATMLDTEPEAVKVIKSNAQKTKLFEKCVILGTDWKAFVRGAAGKNKYDIIFIDPPYASGIVGDVIERLCKADMIADNGVIICESDSPEEYGYEGLIMRRHSKYGRVYITLLDKKASESDEE